MESYVNEGIDYGNDVIPPKIFSPVSRARLACVASVSSRVIARKLEREQKKMEGGVGREKRKRLPANPFIPFFALVPILWTNSRGNASYAG